MSCLPGVFRARSTRAREITKEMEVAAAHAIASVVKPDELEADYIVPSVFNREVATAVAQAVSEAAERCGVARKQTLERQPDPSALSVS